MIDFINNSLRIGDGFSRADASTFINNIWGSAGTMDIETFTITNPVVDLAGSPGVKLVAGNITIS